MNTWLGINLWPSSKDPSSSSSDPRSSPPSPSSTSNDADVVVVVVVVVDVVVRVVDFFGGNRPRLKVKAPPSSRGSLSAAAGSDVIVEDVVVVVDVVSRLTFCLRAPNPLAFSTSSTYSSSLIKSDLSSASSSSSPPKIPIPVSSSLSGLCFSESEAPKASCRPGPWDEILGPEGLYKRSH